MIGRSRTRRSGRPAIQRIRSRMAESAPRTSSLWRLSQPLCLNRLRPCPMYLVPTPRRSWETGSDRPRLRRGAEGVQLVEREVWLDRLLGESLLEGEQIRLDKRIIEGAELVVHGHFGQLALCGRGGFVMADNAFNPGHLGAG